MLILAEREARLFVRLQLALYDVFDGVLKAQRDVLFHFLTMRRLIYHRLNDAVNSGVDFGDVELFCDSIL